MDASVLVLNWFAEDRGLPAERNRSAAGSGTIVAVDPRQHTALVLTCKHLLEHGVARLTVTLRTGGRLPASFVASDDQADLAAVAIAADASTSFVPLTDKPQALARGQPCIQIGYPRMQGPKVRLGNVRRYEQIQHMRAPSLILSFPIEPGDSGGGVFAKGRLVAVMWGKRTFNGQVLDALATGPEDLRRFYDRACFLWRRQGQGQRAKGKEGKPGSIAGRLAVLEERLKVLRAQMEQHKVDRQQAADLLARLREDLSKLQENGIKAGGRIDALEKFLDRASGGLGQLRTLDGRLDKVKQAAGDLAPLVRWAGWLPLVAGGAASGGILPFLLLALSILRRFKPVPALHYPITPIAHDPAANVAPATEKISTRDNPPPPQVIRDEHTYVPYQVPNGELAALKQAMDELVRKHPGCVDTIETLKGFAKQFQSGQKKT